MEEFKFRYTTIKGFNGVRHHVPNGTFLSQTISNFNKQEQTKVALAWTVTFAAPSLAIVELREKLLKHLRSGAENVGSFVDVNVSFTEHSPSPQSATSERA